MANVQESQSWETGVYQLETTDPILGGPNGTSNIQAKQLANRTSYLKQRADQVDAAKSTHPTLASRLDDMQAQAQALGVDMQDMSGATLKFALDMALLANKGVNELRKTYQQEGQVIMSNRGLIKGCTVTKNLTVSRNLDLTGGSCFLSGQSQTVAAKNGAAAVPTNPTGSTVVLKAYLLPDAASRALKLGVTSIGEPLPAKSIPIYNITIPAGNSNSDLTGVTLTRIARSEPLYPIMFDSEPTLYIALPHNLASSDYRVDFDVVDYRGGRCDNDNVLAYSRANNGFSIKLNTTSDDVKINWRISHLNH